MVILEDNEDLLSILWQTSNYNSIEIIIETYIITFFNKYDNFKQRKSFIKVRAL